MWVLVQFYLQKGLQVPVSCSSTRLSGSTVRPAFPAPSPVLLPGHPGTHRWQGRTGAALVSEEEVKPQKILTQSLGSKAQG